jgi:hypothetical protein
MRKLRATMNRRTAVNAQRSRQAGDPSGFPTAARFTQPSSPERLGLKRKTILAAPQAIVPGHG